MVTIFLSVGETDKSFSPLGKVPPIETTKPVLNVMPLPSMPEILACENVALTIFTAGCAGGKAAGVAAGVGTGGVAGAAVDVVDILLLGLFEGSSLFFAAG